MPENSATEPRPESTYRIQFHAGFTFHDAASIAGYLKQLGITHLYASPYLRARAGSTHGYDVVDHNELSPELGGEAGFRELVAALRQHEIQQILDTVPNHMGVGTNDNSWWNDVLEKGQASQYRNYFDIAWKPSPRPYLRGRILLPILGDHYGKLLESGQLKLVQEDGRYFITCYDRRLPVSTASIERISRRISGPKGELAEQISASPDLLHELISDQHYRLSYWRTAADEINYRRFFDINDLAALQMQRREVFDATHALTLKLVREGIVAGLRIDHPDGLYDPQQYFAWLREAGVKYVLAEKILGTTEPLPHNWAIDGTSGYDELNAISGLFVDSRNADAFSLLYQRHTGSSEAFSEIVYQCKLLVLRISMASELSMLAHMLDDIAQSHRNSQDFTLSALTEALRHVIACFPVYRSYITCEGPLPRDAEIISAACAEAAGRNPEIDPSAFEFLRKVLLLQWPAEREAMLCLAGKFQQLTSPVAAKGVEDTAFYRYNRLVSLNEVGGDPAKFGRSPEEVHHYFAERQRLWPYSMNTLSTHDTKRSDDVRARLNVLSEIPEQWNSHLLLWMNMCKDSGVHADDVYVLLQAMIGVWPLEKQEESQMPPRLKAYMTKALREAKLRSSWTRPDESYEATMGGLIDALISSAAWQADFEMVHKRVAKLGAINSLAQTVLKLTLPGVPDTYQGSELWDFSLVDPDNRRPVDYELRSRLLSDSAEFSPPMLQHWHDARIKLFVTSRLLHLRKLCRGLFTTGEYEPLWAAGEKSEHAFSFVRRSGQHQALVVVPRLVAGLLADDYLWPMGEQVWGDTRLLSDISASRLHCVFTNTQPASLKIGDLLQSLPVGVFTIEAAEGIHR